MYRDEIIHFQGGLHEYIGVLDQTEHPNGSGWWRIKNPCSYIVQQVNENTVKFRLVRIWGMDKLYRKFVDIYCPSDSLMEIRVLDKDGGLYKAYRQEIDRPDVSRIHLPPH